MWTPFTQRRWLYKTVTFVWSSVIFLKGSVWTAFTQKGMFRFFYQQYWDEIFRSNFSKLEGTRETVPFVWTPFTQSSMFLARRSPTFFRKIFSKRQVFLEFFYMSYRPWTFSCIIFCMYISLVPNNRSKYSFFLTQTAGCRKKIRRYFFV